MYSTRPPRPGHAPDPGDDWGIRRAVRLMFPDPAELTRDADHTARLGVYLTDMLRPYRLGLAPGALQRGGGQSYGEMAASVIEMAVRPDDDIEVLVLAFAIPDITPGRATATYLSHICPGNPLAFAICDQGKAAAFTGMRIIRDYAAGGGCRRALLVIVEQAELPYDPGVPAAVPAAHAAVALVFGDHTVELHSGAESGSPDRLGRLGMVGIRPGVPAGDARTVLSGETTELRAGWRDVTLILGASLAAGESKPSDGLGLPEVNRVRTASGGQPYTGVWWELAGEFADGRAPDAGAEHRRVLLADHDAQLGYLCLAAIDLSGEAEVIVASDADLLPVPQPDRYETVR